MMRAAFGVLVVLAIMVSPAWAQSGTGVSVSLVGDIVRSNGSNTNLDFIGIESRDGEALGFSLRLDRALGSRWGVELEYVRGGEIESDSRQIPLPLVELSTSLANAVAGFRIEPSSLSVPIQSRRVLKDRLSTVSTLAWFRQSLGDRTSLIYSAGIAFGIGQTESTFSYIGLPVPTVTSKYTSYSVNPIVGLDARISMTEHVSLVPGVRVVGASGSIIVRPSVGLRWEF